MSSNMDLDAELEANSTAVFGDLPDLLRMEIFQYLDILKLLTLRRVCKEWNSSISSESAPLLRTVAVPIATLYRVRRHFKRYLKGWTADSRFWRFTPKVTTVLMFENPAKEYSQWSTDGPTSTLYNMWTEYHNQVQADGRTCLVSKVIYADTVVDSRSFLHTMVNRPGFQTVLYRCDLDLAATSCLFRSKLLSTQAQKFNEAPLYIELTGKHMYESKEIDQVALRTLDKSRIRSLAAIHFASVGAVPLQSDQVDSLVKRIEETRKPAQLSSVVKQLVKKFQPENSSCMEFYTKGKLTEFVTSVRPAVAILLNHFLSMAGSDGSKTCSCVGCQNKAEESSSSDAGGSSYKDPFFSDDDEEEDGSFRPQMGQMGPEMMAQFLLHMYKSNLKK